MKNYLAISVFVEIGQQQHVLIDEDPCFSTLPVYKDSIKS
jgi:hypothetical protein